MALVIESQRDKTGMDCIYHQGRGEQHVQCTSFLSDFQSVSVLYYDAQQNLNTPDRSLLKSELKSKLQNN